LGENTAKKQKSPWTHLLHLQPGGKPHLKNESTETSKSGPRFSPFGPLPAKKDDKKRKKRQKKTAGAEKSSHPPSKSGEKKTLKNAAFLPERGGEVLLPDNLLKRTRNNHHIIRGKKGTKEALPFNMTYMGKRMIKKSEQARGGNPSLSESA